MKKSLIILTIILITITLFATNPNITGKIINEDKYSYTKAICDNKNYCEDYIIECKGKTITKLTPTGFAIQQDINWQDPRKQTNNHCN